MPLSQIEVFEFVSNKIGNETLSTKKINNILNASLSFSNEIKNILNEKDTFYKKGDNVSITEWLLSDDTGQSSIYMAYILFQNEIKLTGQLTPRAVSEKAYPRDYDDLGRCIRMLEATGFQLNLDSKLKLAATSEYWEKIMENWDDWKSLYENKKHKELYSQMNKVYNEIKYKK